MLCPLSVIIKLKMNAQNEQIKVVELKGITKTFGSIIANKNVNLDLYKGDAAGAPPPAEAEPAEAGKAAAPGPEKAAAPADETNKPPRGKKSKRTSSKKGASAPAKSPAGTPDETPGEEKPAA